MKLQDHPMKTTERQLVLDIHDWARRMDKAAKRMSADVSRLKETYEGEDEQLGMKLDTLSMDLDFVQTVLHDLRRSTTDVLI